LRKEKEKLSLLLK